MKTCILLASCLTIGLTQTMPTSAEEPEDPVMLSWLSISKSHVSIHRTATNLKQRRSKLSGSDVAIGCRKIKFESVTKGEATQVQLECLDARFYASRVSGKAPKLFYDSASHKMRLAGTDEHLVQLEYKSKSHVDSAKLTAKEIEIVIQDSRFMISGTTAGFECELILQEKLEPVPDAFTNPFTPSFVPAQRTTY